MRHVTHTLLLRLLPLVLAVWCCSLLAAAQDVARMSPMYPPPGGPSRRCDVRTVLTWQPQMVPIPAHYSYGYGVSEYGVYGPMRFWNQPSQTHTGQGAWQPQRLIYYPPGSPRYGGFYDADYYGCR